MKKACAILLACLLLSGCAAQSAEETLPPETTVSVPETTTPTETAVPATEPESSGQEMPEISGLEPGYYVISSVGRDGDITFYGDVNPENGYLLLNADGTGTFLFEGVEGALTWEEDAVHWQGQTLMGATMSYYDAELEREDTMLMLYFMDPVVSVVLRPAPAPEEST